MKANLQRQIERLKKLPKWQRVSAGVVLIIGGILGALPILGFWMIPLGLALLAVDYPWAKRANERLKSTASRIRERWRKR